MRKGASPAQPDFARSDVDLDSDASNFVDDATGCEFLHLGWQVCAQKLAKIVGEGVYD